MKHILYALLILLLAPGVLADNHCQETTPQLIIEQNQEQTIRYEQIFSEAINSAEIQQPQEPGLNIELGEEELLIQNQGLTEQKTINIQTPDLSCPVFIQPNDLEGGYCHTEQFSAAQEEPNVYFVVDESGSMREKDGTGIRRIDRVKQGLQQLIPLAETTNIGIMGYRGACDGRLANEYLPTEKYGPAQLQEAIDGLRASGSTPMHAAINKIRNQTSYELDNDPLNSERQKYVVLLGDGEPNTCQCVRNDGECEEEVVSEIEKLYEQNGIRTFVIGFNFNSDTYNDFAEAGRTDNTFDDNPDQRYFLADDSDTLITALEQITQTAECSLPLNIVPRSKDDIDVIIGDETIPREDFEFIQESNSVQLIDNACEEYRSGREITIGTDCIPSATCRQPIAQRTIEAPQSESVSYEDIFNLLYVDEYDVDDLGLDNFSADNQAEQTLITNERAIGDYTMNFELTSEELTTDLVCPVGIEATLPEPPECEENPEIILEQGESTIIEYTELFNGNTIIFNKLFPEIDEVTIEELDDETGIRITNDNAEINTELQIIYEYPDNPITCEINALLLGEEFQEEEPGDEGETGGDGENNQPPTSFACMNDACDACGDYDCFVENSCFDKTINIYEPNTNVRAHQIRNIPGEYESEAEVYGFSADTLEAAYRYTPYTITPDPDENGAIRIDVFPEGQSETLTVCAGFNYVNFPLETGLGDVSSSLIVVGTRAYAEILDDTGPHTFSAKVWIP